jgi:hypothetical protein
MASRGGGRNRIKHAQVPDGRLLGEDLLFEEESEPGYARQLLTPAPNRNSKGAGGSQKSQTQCPLL